jgi:K+ transporter
MVMIGTCMVIGDGVLTPAISGTYTFSPFFCVHHACCFVITHQKLMMVELSC